MPAAFQGEVRTQWLTEHAPDRRMRLLEDFAFLDRSGKRWVARRGEVIDGASIPELLWSQLAGTPFVGDYRRASVLHDVYCQRREEPHRAVHRMFYEAMRADGVDRLRARVMYLAVRTFGPHWGPAPEDLAAPPDLDAFERLIDALLGE